MEKVWLKSASAISAPVYSYRGEMGSSVCKFRELCVALKVELVVGMYGFIAL
jgi:hypothetical protein